MKKYRIWLEDSVESEGGFWWICEVDKYGFCHQLGFDYKGKLDQLETLQSFIDDGYKIEEL